MALSVRISLCFERTPPLTGSRDHRLGEHRASERYNPGHVADDFALIKRLVRRVAEAIQCKR